MKPNNILLQKEIIDISNWNTESDYDANYPKGARDKYQLVCPENVELSAGSKNKKFLFKYSWKSKEKNHNCPEQFWVEIIAYYVGCVLQVPVPKSYTAYNGKEYGVLIEWFYDTENSFSANGGSIINSKISNYDFKRGKQHNFLTILEAVKEFKIIKNEKEERDFMKSWSKIFLFDALIGNTDRHHDNWEIIYLYDEKKKILSPAFDNGASLGWRVKEKEFKNFDFEEFVRKGKQHMKWGLGEKQINHFEFLKKLIENFPYAANNLKIKTEKFSLVEIKNILQNLLYLSDNYVNKKSQKLTQNRIDFIYKLLDFRKKKLLEIFNEKK